MNKKRQIISAIGVLLLGVLITAGSFAYWTWLSSPNKNVVFNTSKELMEYINYDEGESTFVGDFKVSDSYTDGIHSTISVSKKEEASSVNLTATINMDINSIGTNIASSSALKWVVTRGDSTNIGETLSSGNFLGVNSGESLMLVPNIEITTTEEKYTMWIWLDAGENPDSNLTGETLDTVVWTEINQTEGLNSTFKITKLTTNYQLINATVVNNTSDIVAYAVTSENIEPLCNNFEDVELSPLVNNGNTEVSKIELNEWIEIPESDRTKVYNFSYAVNDTGTYYIWFKDEKDKVTSNSVTINSVNNISPICVWGEFEPRNINIDEVSTITLTCTDDNMVNKNITIDDLELSSNIVTLSDNIVKETITNGYKYTFSFIGKEYGKVTLTLPKNTILDKINNGNEEIVSSTLTVADFATITYKDVGDIEFSGVHEEGYPTEYILGESTILDIPTKKGYTFAGYYLTSDGSGEFISKIDETQLENIILYAKWIDNPPYGTASLSLSDGVFTLSLSDYGDDGSGLIDTFGYALVSSGSCENAIYEELTELSKIYSENLVNDTIYYGCIKLTDESGSVVYIKSLEIEYFYQSMYTEYGEYEFVVPKTGIYRIELWGAQGGTFLEGYSNGGYTKGEISLNNSENLYINVGGQGSNSSVESFNGGGRAGNGTEYGFGYSGGGATDVRYENLELNDRIMVAGGGGGSAESSSYCSAGEKSSAGGLTGYAGGYHSGHTYNNQNGKGGTQIAGGVFGTNIYSGTGTVYSGSFGLGGNNLSISSGYGAGGGGGGWYGGGGGGATGSGGSGQGGGGGSSYISGHTGSVAIESSTSTTARTGTDGASCDTGTTDNLCSIHYSGKYFTDTVMIDGVGYSWTNEKGSLQQMPNPNGGYYDEGEGHIGDGVAKITLISSQMIPITLTYNNNGGSGCTSKSIITGSTYGELCTPIREGYKFNGWYTSIGDGENITSNIEVTATENQIIYAHWIESTNPVITFGTNGNDEYVSGNISSIINVTKGSNSLDASTFKYIWSTDINAIPNKNFISGLSYTLEDASGLYYLIVSVCDVEGNCTKEISNHFYVDNNSPSGSVGVTLSNSTITTIVSANDNGSGLMESYGYSISMSDTCDSSVSFTESINSIYNFTLSKAGTYYVCIKIKDNANNVGYIRSNAVVYDAVITYTQISTNYSCSNKSVGVNPIFTYTGECELVDDSDENWKVRFLTSGTLTLMSDLKIDAFLVGGGGGGGGGGGSSGGLGGGGGGGYTTTLLSFDLISGNYDIVIGAGGAGKNTTSNGTGSSGGITTAFDLKANGGSGGRTNYYYDYANGGAGGSGGSGIGYTGGSNGSNGSGPGGYNGSGGSGQGSTTCEFGEDGCSDDLLYAGGGGGAADSISGIGKGGAGGGGAGGSYKGYGSSGIANTGGGGGGGAAYSGGAGGSGVVVIRNARSNGTPLNFNYKCENQVYGSNDFVFIYSGECEPIDEGNDNWKVRFLTSGTLNLMSDLKIDAFLVGGGGGGGGGGDSSGGLGGGGGGGYTTTLLSLDLISGDYDIVIGAGGSGKNITSSGTGSNGEITTAFDLIANGGTGGGTNYYYDYANGGAGGSGGSGIGYTGGSNGSNGSGPGGYNGSGGSGQGSTTCEFGEDGCSDDLLYAGGGGGAADSISGIGKGGAGGGGAGGSYKGYGSSGIANTGGGGGGGAAYSGGNGGSGIVIIRNAR